MDKIPVMKAFFSYGSSGIFNVPEPEYSSGKGWIPIVG